MIDLRETTADELPRLLEMDRDSDTAEHITRYDLERHQADFAGADIVYLSICRAAQLVGYFILVLEADNASVEFRRIVVDRKGEGIGQQAIAAMENYCVAVLGRQRIWLDVFESNTRGRHIYEKLGYRLFDNGEQDGRRLLLLDKRLG